jgi:hypothetical protein
MVTKLGMITDYAVPLNYFDWYITLFRLNGALIVSTFSGINNWSCTVMVLFLIESDIPLSGLVLCYFYSLISCYYITTKMIDLSEGLIYWKSPQQICTWLGAKFRFNKQAIILKYLNTNYSLDLFKDIKYLGLVLLLNLALNDFSN